MITTRVRAQLLVFVAITLAGVAFVGGRYAQLDRFFYDPTYQVRAEFVESGGIFTGAAVTYRGVGIGRVSDMRITDEGVAVILRIEKKHATIPSDTLAIVGNKSAVGEQYVELAPRSDDGPYLKNGSTIPSQDTRTPVSTTEILTNTDALVRSIPQGSLRTVVAETGAALKDTGDVLARIIDTSTAFIDTANDKFDITTALIRDANTVLRTQADKSTAIADFARDMSRFSDVVAKSDKPIRTLLKTGGASAGEVRTFLEDNEVDLEVLLNNLVTTGEIVVKHLKGIRQILVLYPYMVAGGYTVAAKTSQGYVARFGLVLNMNPGICSQGYDVKERRSPFELDDKPMDMDAACTSPPSKTNARGAQNAPKARVAPSAQVPVATYDLRHDRLEWNTAPASAPAIAYTGGSADVFGKDAWAQLLLGPVTQEAG